MGLRKLAKSNTAIGGSFVAGTSSAAKNKLEQIRKRIAKEHETIMIDDKPADRAFDDLYEQKVISQSV